MTKSKSRGRKIASASVTYGLLGLFVALVAYAIVCFATGRIISFFGYGFSSVKTGSMRPVIESNSIVLVKMIDGESDPFTIGEDGDVVVYKGNVGGQDAFIIHRAIEDHGDGTITTKGDANAAADDPISKDDVVGVYVKTLPLLTKLSRALSTGAGLVLLVLIPCLGLIVCHLITAVRAASDLKEQKEREDAEEELKRQAIQEFLQAQSQKEDEQI